MTDANRREWLLFTAQLPAEPSSARVAMWRRLKSMGAASLPAGAWVLPESDEHAAALRSLADSVRRQGGSSAVFSARTLDGMTSEEIVARFRADRRREYGELGIRAKALLAEIDEETRAGKFTFAELEEVEDDLGKLNAWLAKIASRDFFPANRPDRAAAVLARCETAFRRFAAAVYAKDGAGS